MRVHFKAMESYGAVNVVSKAVVANKVELIQMLFDGLIESMKAAEGHIQHGAIADKGKSLSRANRILFGLQEALDFEKGGEVATHLDELYGYVSRRLLHINMHNDLNALSEIHGLMSEIRQAWLEVPALLPAQTNRTAH